MMSQIFALCNFDPQPRRVEEEEAQTCCDPKLNSSSHVLSDVYLSVTPRRRQQFETIHTRNSPPFFETHHPLLVVIDDGAVDD